MTNDNDAPKRPRGRPRKPRPEGPPPAPKPMGRPPLGDDAKKAFITLRVKPEEHEILSRLAHENGMTLREFVFEPMRRLLEKKKGRA